MSPPDGSKKKKKRKPKSLFVCVCSLYMHTHVCVHVGPCVCECTCLQMSEFDVRHLPGSFSMKIASTVCCFYELRHCIFTYIQSSLEHYFLFLICISLFFNQHVVYKIHVAMWWHMPVILAVEQQRQKDCHEFSQTLP